MYNEDCQQDISKSHQFGLKIGFILCVAVIASSSLDSSLRLWDALSGERVGMMETGPADVWTVCFSPDDKFIISGSHAGKIHMYSVETSKQERTLDTRGKFTLSIAYVSYISIIYLDRS